jgi:hypothetical protein
LFPTLIAIKLALGKAEMEGVYILSSGIYWSYGPLCYKSQYPLKEILSYDRDRTS